MSSLLTDCTAYTTCGNSRKRAQLDGSSNPQSPLTVRSVHTRQIRSRTIASSSSSVRAIWLPRACTCNRVAIRHYSMRAVIMNRMDKSERNDLRVLQAMIDVSPLAMVALDRDGMVLMWSRGAERMFGWTEEEMLGHALEAQ